MEKEFSSITELSKAIQEGVQKIESGDLSVKELDILTREAAELHERLVVLRFKAFDELVKKADQEGPAITNPIRINVPDNQINLIDAIEEQEGSTEDVQEIEEKVEEVLEKPQELPVQEDSTAPQKGDSPRVEEEQEDSSLAAKLSKKPIADLTKSIALNQKFQFIANLFDGNADAYNNFVQQVNKVGSSDDALKSFKTEASSRGWDQESALVEKLSELIERRYL